MTTAHKATWHSVIGGGNSTSGNALVAQTTKVSNRDAANSTILKTRQLSQGAPEERLSRKDFREELERKEQKARDERDGKKPEVDKNGEAQKYRPQAIQDNPFPEDADDEIVSNSDKESGNEENDDDDDDTEELMRELAKIKKEREEEEARQKELQKKEDERSRRDDIFKGNPLLSGAASEDISLKRKWDDDTVFKNQARTAPKEKQRFINDSVRSDFHKKFLNKYVWVDGHAH